MMRMSGFTWVAIEKANEDLRAQADATLEVLQAMEGGIR